MKSPNTTEVVNLDGPQAGITWGPIVANDSLPDYRVYHGIDFMKVSFWLDWDGNRDFFEILDRKKDSMQATESVEFLPVVLRGTEWNLSRTGVRLFNYRLISGDVVLLLSSRGASSNFPSARLEIGSLSSQTVLPTILLDVRSLFSALNCKIVKEQVSEVHLSADFIGIDIKDLSLDNKDRWISRARDFVPSYQSWKLSGCSLGKGDIMLRCYDKILELKRSVHKQEIFADLWGLDSFDSSPVTRVEYQLRRPILKNFRGIDTFDNGLTSPDVLLQALQSLWSYCTTDWSRFSSTVIDRENKHQQRATISSFWEAVRGVVWTNAFKVRREKKISHKDLDSLRKQVRGGMMTVLSFFLQDIYDFNEINCLAKRFIEEDLLSFQQDESEFIKRMMLKRNAVLLGV